MFLFFWSRNYAKMASWLCQWLKYKKRVYASGLTHSCPSQWLTHRLHGRTSSTNQVLRAVQKRYFFFHRLLIFDVVLSNLAACPNRRLKYHAGLPLCVDFLAILPLGHPKHAQAHCTTHPWLSKCIGRSAGVGAYGALCKL